MGICKIENGAVVQTWDDVKNLKEMREKYPNETGTIIEGDFTPGMIDNGAGGFVAPPVAPAPTNPFEIALNKKQFVFFRNRVGAKALLDKIVKSNNAKFDEAEGMLAGDEFDLQGVIDMVTALEPLAQKLDPTFTATAFAAAAPTVWMDAFNNLRLK